jgi:uncharacterized membrane protein
VSLGIVAFSQERKASHTNPTRLNPIEAIRGAMMESKAKLLGHSIHQMLVAFPLGLLATASFFDVVGLWRGNSHWFVSSFWMIIVGVASGLLAAVFGLIDWLAIPPGTRAKAVGLWHAIANVTVLLFFAISWVLRRPSPQQPGSAALALSFCGVAVALVGAWLGGELVDRLGVGIDDGAHLDAPSSLSNSSAIHPARKQIN